jgi:hypothetical protein
MEEKYYQESPAEDLTLAKVLVRPGNQFLDDPLMKDEALLTAANYGSVKVYVVAKADEASTEDMQRWNGGNEPRHGGRGDRRRRARRHELQGQGTLRRPWKDSQQMRLRT